MVQLNKLEKLLDAIVENYKIDVAGASLFFQDSKIDVVICKYGESEGCFMHYYFRDDYKNKIDIDLPIEHIKNFLTKHIENDGGWKNHLLLQNINPNPVASLNETYMNLVDVINNSKKHYPVLLQAILRSEMPESNQEAVNKRPKI